MSIFVTKSFLPAFDKYKVYLEKIWNSNILTNQGPILLEFEQRLRTYLKINNLHFVSNGTIAIQLAINGLGITEGEIITTPFSYVATVSSILWERCTPVFVDIHPNTFCIDPTKIEKAITKNTKAILGVHVFGYPCDVEAIEAIAKKHNIKVIYDGAHAFGCKYKNKSLLEYGDVSTCSFHATKVFHTIEGGCIIAKDKEIDQRLDLTKRFGHLFDEHKLLGINAKSSEFQAAMGLCNLAELENILAERKKIVKQYDKLLKGYVERPTVPKKFKYNYSYYPVLFKNEAENLKVIKALNDKEVYPRRYFYPSLNKLPYLGRYKKCPISEKTALRVLCLPIYVGLTSVDVQYISDIIIECLK